MNDPGLGEVRASLFASQYIINSVKPTHGDKRLQAMLIQNARLPDAANIDIVIEDEQENAATVHLQHTLHEHFLFMVVHQRLEGSSNHCTQLQFETEFHSVRPRM